jgi:hypothetical protein
LLRRAIDANLVPPAVKDPHTHTPLLPALPTIWCKGLNRRLAGVCTLRRSSLLRFSLSIGAHRSRRRRSAQIETEGTERGGAFYCRDGEVGPQESAWRPESSRQWLPVRPGARQWRRNVGAVPGPRASERTQQRARESWMAGVAHQPARRKPRAGDRLGD